MWDAFVIVSIAVAILSMVLPPLLVCRKSRKKASAAPPPEAERPARSWSKGAIYSFTFLNRRGGYVGGKRMIRIRAEHYDRLKDIIRVANKSYPPIVSYLDNIIAAHFEDHAESINDLYRIKGAVTDKNDEPCR